MSQMSFGDAEYTGKRKQTRREVFLGEMKQVVPWKSLLNLIEPFYPIAGGGRHPYPLEANELAREILSEVNAYLGRKGLLLKRGSIVDATIIAAPSSTKNAESERDPEMHQTKKGNQWQFGVKVHIVVDDDSGLAHTVTTTAANKVDLEQLQDLLHSKEEVVHADAGYAGAQNRVERTGLRWEIAAERGRIKMMKDSREKRAIEKNEKCKASIRAKMEHPFRVIKRQFGLIKVHLRELAKNTAHMITLFTLPNLWMAQKRLLAMSNGSGEATVRSLSAQGASVVLDRR